ncbi:mitochondria-eating protein [Camarhynchus parvulus]|uniref:mitochondria-eating protein n=1 Tax=Geospiza parvula TaxID=87175 RepID=UPI00123807F4|nr:mitochondria-eating protein [Camarhynchus parvulus]
MAKDLKSLVGAGSAREMQEKLESWQQNYEGNSADENLSRGCEILELNNAIQKQVFSILNETAQGDDCAAKIKGCLLPSICCTASGSDNVTQDSAEGELQLRDLSCKPRCELRELEDKLSETRVQINQMERDLRASRCNLRRLEQLDEYEQKIENLRDEIAMLDCKKSVIQSSYFVDESSFIEFYSVVVAFALHSSTMPSEVCLSTVPSEGLYLSSTVPSEGLYFSSTVPSEGLLSMRSEGLLSMRSEGLLSMRSEGLLSMPSKGLLSMPCEGLLSMPSKGLLSMPCEGLLSMPSKGLLSMPWPALHRAYHAVQGPALHAYHAVQGPALHAYHAVLGPALHAYHAVQGPALHAYHAVRGPALHAYHAVRGPALHAYHAVRGPALHAYHVVRGPALHAYHAVRGPALHAYHAVRGPALHAYPVVRAPALHAYPAVQAPALHAYHAVQGSALLRCAVSGPVSGPCRALCPRPCSPPRLRRGSASHRACLIARYNFIYAKERLEAECILRRYVCNLETVQRIIYIACVESFRAAKMAFWKVKINVKDTLAICYRGGPTSLEVAVLDYIACHKDLYDVCCSVHEVVCCMNRNPKLPCPGELDFVVISALIREVCCLAYSMQTLIPPLDIAYGVDGECFNRNMYFRSFDSDFAAPFVAYHVWPPLIEDGTVIVKGEVVTKKMVMCPRRCRIRSRSCSCGRPLLCGQVPRSRSLSTVRVKRRC